MCVCACVCVCVCVFVHVKGKRIDRGREDTRAHLICVEIASSVDFIQCRLHSIIKCVGSAESVP